jgi:tetratricopeptide (TPR) repeat protein
MLANDLGKKLLHEGLIALDSHNYRLAMSKLNAAGNHGIIEQSTQFESAYAVCLAAMKQQYDKAISMCRWAIALEPCETSHYLQLGRVYLLANNRKASLHIFREGMLYRRDTRIIREMEFLGVRRRPVFHSLPRGNFLNRMAGRLVRRFIR